MAVDNDKIKTTIDALELKADEMDKKMAQMRRAKNNLAGILQIEKNIQDPAHPDDPSKTIDVLTDIMDEAFGKKMTSARRQEIYDKWIAEAETLLA